MKPQLSQDYNVDSRYRGLQNARDNDAGKAFVNSYIQRRQEEGAVNNSAEKQTEDRFIVVGPGSANYSFRNAFRAKQ